MLRFSLIFTKIGIFPPKNSEENKNCVFEVSVLIVYDIYDTAICLDKQKIKIFKIYTVFPNFGDF